MLRSLSYPLIILFMALGIMIDRKGPGENHLGTAVTIILIMNPYAMGNCWFVDNYVPAENPNEELKLLAVRCNGMALEFLKVLQHLPR